MKFELPELPYTQNALNPIISERTVNTHYEKHHAGYLKKLEAALSEQDSKKSLEDIIIQSFRQEDAKVFNSAAQVWNHTFYWHSMSPDSVNLEHERLQGLIDKSFGSKDHLLEKLKDAAISQFGSGWAWLLYNGASDELEVTSTSDALTPVTSEKTPLLTIDVWEHAYYLDYQQDRARYVDGFLERLINWQFASDNLDNA